MTILEKVNAIIGPSAASHTSLISTLVEMCQDEATQYCNLDEYTEKLDNAVVQMVVERFNRNNNEGVSSSNASDIQESFIDGYSKSTLSMLNKCRKVKTV